MKIARLVWREIVHRKLNFGLGVLSVLAATALVVGGLTLLGGYRRLTGDLVAEKRAAVDARNNELNDAMRIITKRMGFNIVIMPKGQNLDDPFADDFASRFMPEEYADRIARSPIVTINHILPALEQRVQWSERQNRTVFLVGVKGQVPMGREDSRQPIMQPVPEGGLVVGSSLAKMEGLAEGQSVTLLGEALKVVKVNSRRGDKNDMTAWIDLKLMQRLFKKPGQINAIWALECSCALADVGQVRAELEKILPDVDIEEQGEKALARAEARKKAVEVADRALAEEEQSRERLVRLGNHFRRLFMPLIIIAAGLWLGLLAVANVRERRSEIGLLRALGVGSRQIAALFLSRAALTGLLGAALGSPAGFFLGSRVFSLASQENPAAGRAATFDAGVFLCVLLLAPLLSALACWLPALAATQQDPAAVLREE